MFALFSEYHKTDYSKNPLTDQSKSNSVVSITRALTCARSLQLLAKSFGSVSEKLGYMKSFLTGNPGASVIYVTFRKQTKSITKFLATFGIKALPYHAGMSFSSRAEVQEEFMKSENTTVISPQVGFESMTDSCVKIVATIAFGLGINKPNIRNIIHFDCPRSLEQYRYQISNNFSWIVIQVHADLYIVKKLAVQAEMASQARA